MSRIQLKSDGTILLGEQTTCDGFAWQYPIRVQTHIHHDHMIAFNTSKANQTILMSAETRDLLIALHGLDLLYRPQIIGLPFDTPYEFNGERIELVRSNHMLGSAQVLLICRDGYRLGYSSDFFWPLKRVIQVDELIVDATYGGPDTCRSYRQRDVDEKLMELVCTRVRSGKQTALIGSNGRLHHALSLLGDVADCPFICSPRAFPLVDVYERYGFAMPTVLAADSLDALRVLRDHTPCLAFVTFQDRRHLGWVDRFSKISLSAYTTGTGDPVLDYGNGDCRIAFTDHADFDGTLQYIAATGARLVWADPRSGDAEGLARAVTAQLGIECRVPTRIQSLGWG
jgi:putative mRNA 3-end processing factor